MRSALIQNIDKASSNLARYLQSGDLEMSLYWKKASNSARLRVHEIAALSQVFVDLLKQNKENKQDPQF